MLRLTPCVFSNVFTATIPLWARGRVVSWDLARQFGFVQSSEDGKRYFAHGRDVVCPRGTIPNPPVDFEVEFVVLRHHNRAVATSVTAGGGGSVPGSRPPMRSSSHSSK